MSRRTAAVVLAIPLAVLTILALQEGGLAGFYHHHRSWGGLQVFMDLVIMALLACVWMVSDAGRQGIRAWPFVVLTLVAGSFGPLAYLIAVPAGVSDQGAATRAEGCGRTRLGARLLLGLVTVLFALLTAKALLVHGYFGIWRLQFTSWASLQVLGDLTVLCLLGCGWMVMDARRRGRASWPYLLLTLGAGSFGPLLYLLVERRPEGQGPQ